jgi:hypothetical protein
MNVIVKDADMIGKHLFFVNLVQDVRLVLGMLKRKMPYKDKVKQENDRERRRMRYQENKEEINRKIREHDSIPEFREQKKKYEREYRIKNLDKLTVEGKKRSKKCRDKFRELVFNHYGKQCICCGESNIKFLTIDHMNGNGRKHRAIIKNHIHTWLVKNNYPKGFQVLCYNCNCGKRMNNGICPHKDNN